MENQKKSFKQIVTTHGLYLALVSILLLVVMYVTNTNQNWAISLVSFALTVLILVYAIKTFKQQNENYLSLGEGLKVGVATAAIAGVLAGVYAYLHYSFIYPEYIDTVIDEARMQMAEQSQGMTEEQMEQALGFTESFTTPFMMATFSLIGSLFFGFIISLIASLIMKRERPAEI
ncbi:DUF4199 domain-containing protein [uncultured Planktosalinus sp.]|uniref:DUF4199 domain-containing protein n=1 Tax=uncultured Planktosalinus sp. TaxID=1810935 RepID=UPI0030DC7CD5